MSNKNFQIYSSVLEYLHKHFPAPFYLKTDKYEGGTILFTANPYFRTNGTIIDVLKENSMYQVLTDIGNIIDQSVDELRKSYLPPVCKRTNKEFLSLEDNFSIDDAIKILNMNRIRKVKQIDVESLTVTLIIKTFK